MTKRKTLLQKIMWKLKWKLYVWKYTLHTWTEGGR